MKIWTKYAQWTLPCGSMAVADPPFATMAELTCLASWVFGSILAPFSPRSQHRRDKGHVEFAFPF